MKVVRTAKYQIKERYMKTEIYWMTLTVLATALFWLPYIIDRILEHDLLPALRNPERDTRPESKWANRMMYAH
ncbi:hypothetical protein [Pseudoalteromonas denitrificans]|nr:hypothetical protein [Pseudoalteromonas denitrificans]